MLGEIRRALQPASHFFQVLVEGHLEQDQGIEFPLPQDALAVLQGYPHLSVQEPVAPEDPKDLQQVAGDLYLIAHVQSVEPGQLLANDDVITPLEALTA